MRSAECTGSVVVSLGGLWGRGGQGVVRWYVYDKQGLRENKDEKIWDKKWVWMLAITFSSE